MIRVLSPNFGTPFISEVTGAVGQILRVESYGQKVIPRAEFVFLRGGWGTVAPTLLMKLSETS